MYERRLTRMSLQVWKQLSRDSHQVSTSDTLTNPLRYGDIGDEDRSLAASVPVSGTIERSEMLFFAVSSLAIGAAA